MYERVGEEIKRRVRFLVIRRTLLTAILVIAAVAAVGSNNEDLVAPAIIAGIIVMTYRTSPPVSSAFYTEVIVTFTRQFTHPRTTFKQTLRQCDTSRNFMYLHLFDSKVFILIYIVYIT